VFLNWDERNLGDQRIKKGKIYLKIKGYCVLNGIKAAKMREDRIKLY